MTQVAAQERKNWLRRSYDWVLHWAETPYGPPALFVLAFAESSFFPIPPDVLLIALAVSIPGRSFRFAAICTAGSLLGAYVGYAIGYFGYDLLGAPIVDFYNGQEVMDWVQQKYQEYGFWGIFVAALTPIPYKVFTIASGLFHFPLGSFTLASVLGRSLRFFAVAALIFKFGAPVKEFIERRFNLVAILFVLLLVGGFALLKFAM